MLQLVKRATWILGALLVVSLVAHVFRTATAPSDRSSSSSRPPSSSLAPATSDAPARLTIEDDDTEDEEPAREPARKRRVERKSRLARTDDDGSTGEAAQQRALCKKAKESLDESWRRDSERFVASLTASLADPAALQRDITTESRRMANALELDDARARALESDYAAIRTTRTQEALRALYEDPPDVEAVLEAAKDLFADQDALVLAEGGAQRLEVWRRSELESRTVILALLASTAGVPWDEELVW